MSVAEAGRPKWPLLGVIAGVFGAAILMLATGAEAYDEGSAAVAEKLSDDRQLLTALQFAGWIATAAVLVFGVQFHRMISARVPAGSVLPQVIAWSFVASLGALIVAYGLLATLADTLPGFSYFPDSDAEAKPIAEQDFPVDVKSSLYWTATNAICYAWVGICAVAGATAVAVFRYGAFARWTGYFSAFIAAIMVVFLAVGLPFGAVFWGPLWLIVMGVALAIRVPAPSPTRTPVPA